MAVISAMLMFGLVIFSNQPIVTETNRTPCVRLGHLLAVPTTAAGCRSPTVADAIGCYQHKTNANYESYLF